MNTHDKIYFSIFMFLFLWTLFGTIAWISISLHAIIHGKEVLSDRGWKVLAIISGPLAWACIILEKIARSIFNALKRL